MSLPVNGNKQDKRTSSAPVEKFRVSKTLLDATRAEPAAVLAQLDTRASGLSDEQAAQRLGALPNLYDTILTNATSVL